MHCEDMPSGDFLYSSPNGTEKSFTDSYIYIEPKIRDLRREWLNIWNNYNKTFEKRNFEVKGNSYNGLKPKKNRTPTSYSTHRMGSQDHFHPEYDKLCIEDTNGSSDKLIEDIPGRPCQPVESFKYKRNLKCKICGASSYIVRYSCLQCEDFHICPFCEVADLHSSHYMLRIPAGGDASPIEAQLVLAAARRAVSQTIMIHEKDKATSSPQGVGPKTSIYSTFTQEPGENSDLSTFKHKVLGRHVASSSKATFGGLRYVEQVDAVSTAELSSEKDSETKSAERKKKLTKIKMPKLKLDRETKIKCRTKTIERKRTVLEKIIQVPSDKLNILMGLSQVSVKSEEEHEFTTLISSKIKCKSRSYIGQPKHRTVNSIAKPPIRLETLISELNSLCDSCSGVECTKKNNANKTTQIKEKAKVKKKTQEQSNWLLYWPNAQGEAPIEHKKAKHKDPFSQPWIKCPSKSYEKKCERILDVMGSSHRTTLTNSTLKTRSPKNSPASTKGSERTKAFSARESSGKSKLSGFHSAREPRDRNPLPYQYPSFSMRTNDISDLIRESRDKHRPVLKENVRKRSPIAGRANFCFREPFR